MGLINLPNTSRGDDDLNLFADVKDNDQAIVDEVNGSLDDSNIADDAAIDPAKIDFSEFGSGNGIVTAGKSIISAEESTSSTSFTTLTTPDTVSNITLPTDGLIFVNYRALCKLSTLGGAAAGKAAIFLGSTQMPTLPAPTTATEATISDDEYQWLYTDSGLQYAAASGAASDIASTGVMLGAAAVLEADAGTYTISVKFKKSSGSPTVSAKSRKLRVWSQSFG